MRKKTIILTILTTVLLMSSYAGADELDEILAKNYEARGGLDAIKSIQSIRYHGTTLAMGQVEAPMVIEMERPNRVRVEFTIHGMTVIQAFDGTTAWMVMPFLGSNEAELIPEEQARSLREKADMDGLLVDWETKGHTVELLGTEELEGTAVYKLRVTTANGIQNLIYLDAEYGLELMQVFEQVVPGQGETIKVVTTVSDYKEVDGVMMAHSVESKTGDNVMSVMTIDRVEINPEIADGRFTMPPETGADG